MSELNFFFIPNGITTLSASASKRVVFSWEVRLSLKWTMRRVKNRIATYIKSRNHIRL